MLGQPCIKEKPCIKVKPRLGQWVIINSIQVLVQEVLTRDYNKSSL